MLSKYIVVNFPCSHIALFRETSPLDHRVNLSRKLTELYCAERQGGQKPERELLMLRVTRQFLSIHGYASVVYFTAIMHCRSEDTHLFGPLCYTSSLSHAHEVLNVSSGDTHTHTHYIHHIHCMAFHISNLPSDTLSPSTLCVLLRPLSAVTDRMTGGRCYDSCLGWWPHSWVPPAPHLGTLAASHASQTKH